MDPTNAPQQVNFPVEQGVSPQHAQRPQQMPQQAQQGPAGYQTPPAYQAGSARQMPVVPPMAPPPAQPPKRSGALNSIISFVGMIVAVVVIVMLLRTFVFLPYKIPSASMEETIMTGDMVFSEKVTYYGRGPQYGDIVTFADPEVAGRTLIKRVIATEGQTVDLVDGYVTVDGVTLDEPYTLGKPSYPLERTAPDADVSFPYTVPAGCVWVMGDNRTSSQDSRYFGAVSVKSIDGRAVMIYWPFDHFGLLS